MVIGDCVDGERDATASYPEREMAAKRREEAANIKMAPGRREAAAKLALREGADGAVAMIDDQLADAGEDVRDVLGRAAADHPLRTRAGEVDAHVVDGRRRRAAANRLELPLSGQRAHAHRLLGRRRAARVVD